MRFFRTSRFLKDVKRLRMTGEEVAAVERAIALQPRAGDLIVGLGGARKLRFGLGRRGKSGGGRAIYFLLLGEEAAVLLTA